MDTIRVFLADDHPAVRAGLRTMLEEVPDIEVVAEACNLSPPGSRYLAV